MFRKLFPFLIFLVLLSGCRTRKAPQQSFEEIPAPPAPDYGLLDHWVAHPDLADQADSVPVSQFHNGQAEAAVDVFFIYPTIFFSKKEWNADLRDEKLNKQIENTTIRHQASIFNGVARVYSPRYRQMTFGGFKAEKDQQASAGKALNLAYQDVKAAFGYYLENANQGRPFIIASHSQGTVHAIRLVREEIDGKPLMDHLVAAYLAGWTVMKDTFALLPPCESPSQTGCFASWCSYEAGFEPEFPEHYDRAVCVNPITWRCDTATSTLDQHQGVVMANFNKYYPEKVTAQVHEGYLWVTRPKVPGTWIIGSHNFHIADYNLFWGNVRQNVEDRVKAWQEAHPSAWE